MQINKVVPILLLSISFAVSAVAQKVNVETLNDSIHSIVINKINQSQFKDTTASYAFAFKLDIVKKGSRTEVLNIVANDSLAYELIPSYRSLADISYSAIGEGKKRFSLIIPILISTYGSKHPKYNKNQYIENAISVVDKLFYTLPDHEANVNIPKRFRKIYPKSEKLIYLFPFQLILDMKSYN